MDCFFPDCICLENVEFLWSTTVNEDPWGFQASLDEVQTSKIEYQQNILFVYIHRKILQSLLSAVHIVEEDLIFIDDRHRTSGHLFWLFPKAEIKRLVVVIISA